MNGEKAVDPSQTVAMNRANLHSVLFIFHTGRAFPTI